MSCTGYTALPIFQLDGTRYQGTNCGCAVTAMMIDDATCGAKRTTSARIRSQMGDTSGGTNLGQAAVVADAFYDVRITVRYRLPWAEYEALRKSGRAAYLQISYAPIRDSRFRGSDTFRGNHAMFDPPDGKVIDPLADGRRTGIYKYRGEVYPRELLKQAAGLLDIGGRRLGYGLVYAGFTIDNDVTYAVTMAAGTLDWWRVVDGNAERYIRGATTAGFTRRCTAPKRYPWPGHSDVSLVKLTDGPHAGKWLAVGSPRMTLKTL